MHYVALEGAFEAVGAARGVERTDAVLRSLGVRHRSLVVGTWRPSFKTRGRSGRQNANLAMSSLSDFGTSLAPGNDACTRVGDARSGSASLALLRWL